MSNQSSYTVKVLSSIHEIDAEQWDQLTDDTPLLRHAFLSALEKSQSVGADSGWIPYPLTVWQQATLIGAMPLYLKTHSYGEYVFDWAWADAYAQHGMQYYPKLVSAIPFTPITSKRLLTDTAEIAQTMVSALEALLDKHELSSAHVLFPSEQCSPYFEERNWLKRSGVQFRWQNQQYQDFDDFLSHLNRNKRKKIKQERKKVQAEQINIQWLTGDDITAANWDFFYQCYCQTYYEHHSTPYLTRQFFSVIAESMPENIVLMIAHQHQQPIAATLNFYNQHTLYGRYWGALQYIPHLHFELCYYQAQQFCIEHNITYFEGGAQGEHKLARGFTPRATCSYHKIAHPDFERAIQQFTMQEAESMTAYSNELEERAPYKKWYCQAID